VKPTIIFRNASNWVDRGEPPNATLRRVLAHFFERHDPADEPWLEAGFKDPHYYGVATWSYLLIPAKMGVVLLAGALLAVVLVLTARLRASSCRTARAHTYAVATVGTTFVALTSATLTWVACCATPSWVVALTMLGMSSSLALWLDPLGAVLTAAGFLLFAGLIAHQLRRLATGMTS